MSLYYTMALGIAALFLLIYILRSLRPKSGVDNQADPSTKPRFTWKQAIELLQKAKQAYPERADIVKKLDEILAKP